MVVNFFESRGVENNSFFSKYQTQNIPDRFRARNIYTTEDRTPYSSTRTVYRSVRRELPEKKEMTYQEANIPEPEKKRIARRDIVRTAPESRREYYKQIDEYNRKISEAKREVDYYNQQIREYNKQRIYYERVPVTITTQGEKITYTTKEAGQTLATDSNLTSRFTLQKPETSKTKILSLANQEKISNLLANYKPMVTVEDTRKTSDFLSAPPKLDTKTYFGVGTDKEVPKQNIKLLYTDPYLFGARFEQKIKDTAKYSYPLSLESLVRVGGGFVSGFIIKPAQLTKSLVSEPVPTLKSLPGGIVRSLNPVSIYKSVTSDPYWSAGEVASYLAIRSSVKTLTKPTIIQEPTIKVRQREIDVPRGLKGVADNKVILTEYKTSTPAVQSRLLGLFKKKVFFEGKTISYRPTYTGKSMFDIPKKYKTDTTTYLPEPSTITKSVPLQITTKPTSTLPVPQYKVPQIYAIPKSYTGQTYIDIFRQRFGAEFIKTIGTSKIKIGSRIKTYKINDIDWISTIEKGQIGKDLLPRGVRYYESTSLLGKGDSKLLTLDPSLIKSKIVKTQSGFDIFEKRTPPTMDIESYFLGRTKDARYFGVTYQPKDIILEANRPTYSNRLMLGSKVSGYVTSGIKQLPPPKYLLTTSTPAVADIYLLVTPKVDWKSKLKEFRSKDSEKIELPKSTADTIFSLDVTPKVDWRSKFKEFRSANTLNQPQLKMLDPKTTPIQDLKTTKVVLTKSQVQPQIKISTTEQRKTFDQKSEFKLNQINLKRPRLAPINEIATNQKQRLSKLLIFSPKLSQKNSQIQSQKQRMGFSFFLNFTMPRNDQIIFPITSIRTAQAQAQTQTQIQPQVQAQTQINTNINNIFKKPILPIFTKLTPFGFKLPSKTREEKAQAFKSNPAYNTYVKVGNNWKKVNMASEKNDINKALSLGIDVTDNTSARSFKVERGTGSAKTMGFMPNLTKFYRPSKRKSAKLAGAYIEKPKYLIDTPGEVRGITARGWIANRNKTRRLI